MKIRAMVTISGLVQGVSFRYGTMQQAARCNVTGWVKNLPNGDVQGCFEGEKSDVQALIDWCSVGPRLSRVDRISTEQQDYTGKFEGFRVR
jgi:acylphosphatase